MKCGIVIDAWKLAVFKRRLDLAGYTYEQHPGITPALITLVVITEDARALTALVSEATIEAARAKAEEDINRRLRN